MLAGKIDVLMPPGGIFLGLFEGTVIFLDF